LLTSHALIYTSTASAETVFTYRAAESEKDLRYEYDNNLLKLALDLTIETDGPYTLVPSPAMNFTRAHKNLQDNTLPNFFMKLSYEPGFRDQGMAYVPFPIDLGIVGYRVCFVHPDIEKQLSNVKTLDEFKQFSHGQGAGWSDVEILRKNGFEVHEVATYEPLFKMVAGRRFDLFCRGTNELLGELDSHRNIKDLSYDKSITLSYPLPRFFYTSSDNSAAIDRVRRGILKAYENGSLQELWRQEYQKSVDFVQLDRRREFVIKNHMVDDLDFDYQQYFFKPFKRDK